jgi:hypothetical protein
VRKTHLSGVEVCFINALREQNWSGQQRICNHKVR